MSYKTRLFTEVVAFFENGSKNNPKTIVSALPIVLPTHTLHATLSDPPTPTLHQLDKSVANPAHPLSRFGTGCHETLRDDPQRLGIDGSFDDSFLLSL